MLTIQRACDIVKLCYPDMALKVDHFLTSGGVQPKESLVSLFIELYWNELEHHDVLVFILKCPLLVSHLLRDDWFSNHYLTLCGRSMPQSSYCVRTATCP